MLTGRMSKELLQKMYYMKARHRSDFPLSKWTYHNYWQNQDQILKIEDDFTDNIERVHVDSLTTQEFIERYEKKSKPVILTGVTDNWPATKNW